MPDWSPPPRPSGERLNGRFVVVEPLDAARHAEDLFSAYEGHDQVWDYLPYGPFETLTDYKAFVDEMAASSDTVFHAIVNRQTGHAEGIASYLRINPAAGSIEVGHLNFSPQLQQTRAATEAMFLMMQWAFEAGYRRYEWKCDAKNLPSRRAAQRLGFSYEGIFRQAAVIKGRNRDTAWFACLDKEWPSLREAFVRWLSDDNFNEEVQVLSLGELTSPFRVAHDPAL